MVHESLPSEPDDIVKNARSHFSKIGLTYLLGALAIMAFQSIAFALMKNAKPDLLADTNISTLTAMIPMYLLGVPLMIFLIKTFVPAGHIEKKKMSVGQWLIAFIICYAGMYLSNLVGLFLTQIIGIFKGNPVSNGILDLITSTSIWLNIFLTVLLAPIIEEFLFRKLLIDRTIKYGEGISILFSGLMFGLFHGNLNQFTYAFVLGLLFGFIYVKTGMLRYTIFLHMAINFMGSTVGVLLLKYLDLEAMTNAMQDSASAMPYLMRHLPQFLIYCLYVFLLIGIVIAGIVLFIVNARKFRCMPGEITLPKGKRFSATILNLGMLLYLVYWIGTIIMQLLQ